MPDDGDLREKALWSWRFVPNALTNVNLDLLEVPAIGRLHVSHARSGFEIYNGLYLGTLTATFGPTVGGALSNKTTTFGVVASPNVLNWDAEAMFEDAAGNLQFGWFSTRVSGFDIILTRPGRLIQKATSGYEDSQVFVECSAPDASFVSVRPWSPSADGNPGTLKICAVPADQSSQSPPCTSNLDTQRVYRLDYLQCPGIHDPVHGTTTMLRPLRNGYGVDIDVATPLGVQDDWVGDPASGMLVFDVDQEGRLCPLTVASTTGEYPVVYETLFVSELSAAALKAALTGQLYAQGQVVLSFGFENLEQKGCDGLDDKGGTLAARARSRYCRKEEGLPAAGPETFYPCFAQGN